MANRVFSAYRVQLLVATVLLLPCCRATAQQPATAHEIPAVSAEEVGMSSGKLALVTAALQEHVDDGKVAGAIALVARRGKIALFESVGWRDVDTKTPMQKDSILRFYSMTKPMTSTAIMMLVEAGKIGLDDPVSKFIPAFGNVQVFVNKTDDAIETEKLVRAPTIRDLLRHTAGLTYGFFSNTPVDQEYRAAGVLGPQDDLQATMQKLGKIPLLYQPGTQFHYSVATDVLGQVVHAASGQRLDEFLQEKVFDPLDMRDTGFYVPKDKLDRFASSHGPNGSGGQRVTDAASESRFLQPPQLFSGGGGTVSTGRDYLRFCQMLLNGGELNGTRLLAADTVEQMTRDQLPSKAFPIRMGAPREGVGFGLGFSVVVDPVNGKRKGEYGWGGAASTHFWISPADELAVVVLSQRQPYSAQLETATKPLIYEAIVD